MKVFENHGSALINRDGWPKRAEDKIAFQKWIEHLEKQDKKQAQKNKDAIEKAIRFRAEEVAGACLEDNLPSDYARCLISGPWIIQQIENSASAPPASKTS
jgi:hypothetical protein